MAYSDKIDKPMDQEVERLVSRLMKVSNRGYYRVVSQYFSGMESHASSLRDAVRRNGRLIYVIGDSWLQGVYVPTHRILGRIVKHAGFRSVRIRWIRYRKSGRQHSHTLSEYIVSAMR